MSASVWLNTHPVAKHVWRPLYEFGYQCLKAAVTLGFGPIWGVRRVGHRAHLPKGAAVLCPNHASYLDPAFVQLCVRRRLTFVMTENFYRLTWGRWFFKLVSAVSIGRGRQGRKGLRRAMALVRSGHAIVVFPEGRLTEDGRLNRAQRGIGRLARRLGAPVIPVGIAGGRAAWGKSARGPGRSRVRVAFGRPLTWSEDAAPNAHTSTREAEQQFADRLMAEVGRIRARAGEPGPDDGALRASPRDLQKR